MTRPTTSARSLMGRLLQRKAVIDYTCVIVEANFSRLNPFGGLKLFAKITPPHSPISFDVTYDIGWKWDKLDQLLEPINVFDWMDPIVEETFVFDEDDEVHYKKRFAAWIREQAKQLKLGEMLVVVKTDQSPNIHARLFVVKQEAVEQLVIRLEKTHGGEWQWKAQFEFSATFHKDQRRTELTADNFEQVTDVVGAIQSLAQ